MNRWTTTLLSLLLLASTPNLVAQQITITGVVKDSNTAAVAGAMILEQGTTNGVHSDNKGLFEITVREGARLYISHSEFDITERTIEGIEPLEITLTNDEAVLNIGYGEMEEKSVTGAISSLDANDLEYGDQQDLGNAISTQVAGLSSTSDKTGVGESSQITIRGYSSLFAGTTPLYVVNGVPQEDDPEIPPTEIKSIDVLRDAASCAVYGTRGASGVILITTK